MTESEPLYEQYVASLIFVIESMTSTGYSNLHAVTVPEMWFAAFVMIFGKMLFGWILAGIAATLSNLEVGQIKYAHKLGAIQVGNNLNCQLKMRKKQWP